MVFIESLESMCPIQVWTKTLLKEEVISVLQSFLRHQVGLDQNFEILPE